MISCAATVSRKGNPLVACAPGVKDALVAAAAFEGVTI